MQTREYMRVKKIWAFILGAMMLMGCKSSIPDEQRVEKREQEEIQTVENATYVAPPVEGVFVRQSQDAGGNVFYALAAGETEHLRPTNADRGFGFGAPVGTHLTPEHMLFVVRSSQLNLQWLQISQLDGVAIEPEHWADGVNDANVAWILARPIMMDVNVISQTQGIAEIELEMPLNPGIYVLHDDTMVRAQQPSEVSAYYPFIVTEKGNVVMPWEEEANTCFRQFFKTFGTDICSELPEKLDLQRIRECGMAQRMALKAKTAAVNHLSEPMSGTQIVLAQGQPRDEIAKTGESSALQRVELDITSDEEFIARACYLERLVKPESVGNHETMLRLISGGGSEIVRELWKIEHHDQMMRLVRMEKMLRSGKAMPAELKRAVLEFYAPGFVLGSVGTQKPIANKGVVKGAKKTLSTPQTHKINPLGSLAWVPFTWLDPNDPTLNRLYASILYSEGWLKELVSVLGALHYWHLMEVTRQNRALASWFKVVDKDVPETWRAMASGLSIKLKAEGLGFGPIVFTGIKPELETPWRATLANQKSAVQACLKKYPNQQPGLFILEYTFGGAEGGSSGVLRDPIDVLRPVPILEPGLADCILSIFGQMPSLPTLTQVPQVKMAITVGRAE